MAPSTRTQAAVLDEVEALSSVGGDREFLAELLGLTSAAWPSLMADIRAGIAADDLESVRRVARLAKAAAKYVSANRTYEAAQLLEDATAAGDLAAVRKAGARLQNEVQTLQEFLSSYTTAECAA